MARHIFVTYSSHDRDIADLVLKHLEDAGETVWMAPRDVPSGMSYPEAIIGAIRDCRQALLVLSEHSNVSPHVLREVERISSAHLPLHVLRIDPVELSDGLSYFAGMLQWIEAPREVLARNPREFLDQVLQATNGGAARALPPPAARPPSARPPAPASQAGIAEAISFSEMADARRRMLASFGIAVLDHVGQQSNPSVPVARRELLEQLRVASPAVFGDITFRQFCQLLNEARDGGCAPGLSEDADGVFMLEENIATKRARNLDAKSRIARHAVSMVESGMVLAMDGGSTTQPIAERICDLFEQGELEALSIVTNSLAIADTFSRLMSAQGWTDDTALLQVYLVGGRLRANTHATAWGDDPASSAGLVAELDTYGRGIDLGFIGGNGFECTAGVTMGADAELGVKRFVLANARATYIVADSSKAGITLPVQIASWDEAFTVLTNELPPPAVQNLEELILAGRVIEVPA